jgi:hypothetical protein
MSAPLSCATSGEISGQLTLSTATEHVALAGVTAVASFTAADPNAPASAFTATIDWGDGSSSPGTVVGADGSFTVQGGHAYAEEGSYALRVTVTSSQGATSLDGFVTVAENDVLAAQPPTIEATQNTSFSGVVARFIDSDLVSPASDFSAGIDWGDGTSSPGIVSGSNGSFTVSGTHSYALAGKLPIGVTLSDDGAGTASAVATGSALVVSPAALQLGVTDPTLQAFADFIGPFLQGMIGVSTERIGLFSTIPATEDVALTLPNVLGDVPLPPDIPDVALTSMPVATFIDTNPADTADDFIALINWGDGTTTAGTVLLAGADDVTIPVVGVTIHGSAFVVFGTHTYARASASEILSVGIIRTTDDYSGTLYRSSTLDFANPMGSPASCRCM